MHQIWYTWHYRVNYNLNALKKIPRLNFFFIIRVPTNYYFHCWLINVLFSKWNIRAQESLRWPKAIKSSFHMRNWTERVIPLKYYCPHNPSTMGQKRMWRPHMIFTKCFTNTFNMEWVLRLCVLCEQVLCK